ncbi:hypothetical protein PACTADRAFT_34091 [Pachysolen tannophilus NRRL Y-2460]|uniref:Mitochondrial inner membrane protease subunit n=1 Tax=Pachysolen tannophilus NRRL Y-2460 TaxID=669874 RepID=A0A1E4TUV9_PACTA|nr:hypothetical protein PACTADRAFT_34091 [Pachysolen tannophilus NRRL Y-2460]
MAIAENIIFLKSTLSWTLRAGCFIHFFHSNIYEFKETRGESMLPTLNFKNDYVHCLKSYKYGRGCEIGDMVVALKPTDPDQRVCKRITGMAGDVVLIDPSSGSLDKYKHHDNRNNAAATAQSAATAAAETVKDAFNRYIVVPEGHVWVTGDNLSHSLDSRTYSVMPMGLIKGKIIAANDLNEDYRTWWGFRWMENTFVKETK